MEQFVVESAASVLPNVAAGAPKRRGRPRKSAVSDAARKSADLECAGGSGGTADCRQSAPSEVSVVSSRSQALSEEIRRIRAAKISAENVCASVKMDAARACVEILWEMVFDYLCSSPALDTSEMGTLSSVLQRLVSSRVQLANSDAKFADSSSGGCGEILPETIEKIETALKLL